MRLFILVCMLWSTVGNAQSVSSKDSLRCEIALQGTTLMLSVINQSHQTVEFLTWQSPWDLRDPLRVVILDREGKQLAVRPGTVLRVRSEKRAKESDYLSIRSGETARSPWIDLSAWWELPKMYRVIYVAKFRDGQSAVCEASSG